MAWTLQDSASASSTTSSVSATLGSAVSAGDLIIAWGHCNAGDPPLACFSDNQNGTWPNRQALVDSMASSSGRLAFGAFLAGSVAANAFGLTVTFNGNASATRAHIIVEHWTPSGAGTYSLVGTAVASTTSNSAWSVGPTAASASSGDLGLAASVNSSGSVSNANTPGTGWTAESVGTHYLASEYQASLSGGTVTATGTWSDTGIDTASIVVIISTGAPTTSPPGPALPLRLVQHPSFIGRFLSFFSQQRYVGLVPTTWQIAEGGSSTSSGSADLTVLLAALGGAPQLGRSVSIPPSLVVLFRQLPFASRQREAVSVPGVQTWPLGESGTSTSSGSAAVALVMAIGASGSSTSSGSADMGLLPAITTQPPPTIDLTPTSLPILWQRMLAFASPQRGALPAPFQTWQIAASGTSFTGGSGAFIALWQVVIAAVSKSYGDAFMGVVIQPWQIKLSGSGMAIRAGTLRVQGRVEERTTADFVVITDTGTFFQFGQPVAVIDDLGNTIFSGYVNTSEAEWIGRHPVLSGVVSYPAVVLGDAPTAYWRLGDKGSLAVDATSQGHTGSLSGAVTVNNPGGIVDDPDGCVGFPGAGVITVPDSPAFHPGPDGITVEGWLWKNADVSFGRLVALGSFPNQAWYIQAGTGGEFHWSLPGIGDVATAAIPLSSWHHLVGTWDGSTMRLYLDGAQVASLAAAGTPAPGVGGIGIGADFGNFTSINGFVDEVAVYRHVLTPAQVLAHYSAGIVHKIPVVVNPVQQIFYRSTVLAKKPVAYWRLGETPQQSAVHDEIGGHTGSAGSGVSAGAPGAITDDTDTSYSFTGAGGIIVPEASVWHPTSGGFTVEAWVYKTSDVSFQRIAAAGAWVNPTGVGADWELSADATGRMRWLVFSPASLPTGFPALSGPLALNTWYHIVGTWDGTTARIYINGGLVNSAAVGQSQVGSGGLGIGVNADPANPGTPWNGRIDEVAIYNYALSAAQVADNYITGTSKKIPPAIAKLFHTVNCMDQHYLADKRFVAASYVNQTCGFIVRDFITGNSGNWLALEGVTAGIIQDGPTITAIAFDWIQISKAIDQLAELANFTWWIDSSKKLNFINRLSNVAPWSATSQTMLRSTVKFAKAAPQYRNYQIVKGFTDVTSNLVEIHTGDGQTRSFLVAFPIDQVPTVETKIGAGAFVAQSVGIGQIDTGKAWYWNKGSNTITQDQSGTVLGTADQIRITFKGEFKSVAISADQSAITMQQAIEGGGTSGQVEVVSDLPETTDVNAAFQFIGLKLLQYAVVGRFLNFSTLKRGLQPGMLLTANVPEFGVVNGQFLITAVAASDIRARDQDDRRLIRYDVESTDGPTNDSWAKWFDKVSSLPRTVVNPGQAGTTIIITILGPSVRSENWSYTENNVQTVVSCPVPSTSLLPSTTLFPC